MIVKPQDLSSADRVVLLFDGDLLVYRAGFAAEKRVYTVGSETFKNSKAAKSYCTRKGINEREIKSERLLEPLGNATSNVDRIINSTVEQVMTDFACAEDNVDVVVFLTGCGNKPNFREVVAHDYKANRDPAHKPTFYDEIREYLNRTWATVFTEGAETDDYLGPAFADVAAHDPDCQPVIVSIDKDLLCVPGLHYHFIKKEYKLISEQEGDYNFFCQTLIGDTADNIRGIRGVGPAKAEKLLGRFSTDSPFMAKLCMIQYMKEYNEEWLDRWNANCHMLWIWREIPDVCPWVFESKTEAEGFMESVN